MTQRRNTLALRPVCRTSKRPVSKYAGTLVVAGLSFLGSYFIQSETAHAGGPIARTCAQIDAAQGGNPITAGNFSLTVIAGDRITVTLTTGTQINADPPGAAPAAPVANPFIQDIDASNAGIWTFTITAGLASYSCSVGGAGPSAGDSASIADGFLTTFNKVDSSIFEPDGIPKEIVNPGGITNGGGVTFAPTSAGLAPQIDTSDPFYDKFGFASQDRDLSSLGGKTAGKGFRFSLNMRALMAKAYAKEPAAYGGMKDGGAVYRSRWNTWVAGRYVDYDDDRTNADRDGHLWWVTSGMSYQVNERTVIGGFSRIRQGEVDSTALNAKLDSDFYGGGAFVATRLGNGMRMLGAILYESGDSDITIAGARGSFDSSQWTIEGQIDQRIAFGRGWVQPAVELLYTNMGRDAFTDSTGTRVNSSDLELGRLTFGPTVGTTIQKQRAAIKPFGRIHGVWDFVNDGDFTLSTGAVISNADAAVNLGGGVEVAFENGVVVTAAGDWFAFDDDLDGWALTGGLGMPLAVLGLGNVAPTGFVSLDFAGDEQTASAKARVKLPLN